MSIELTKLLEIAMHAPIEVAVTLYVMTPDGQVGTLRTVLPAGRYPSQEDMQKVVQHALGAEGVPEGLRLLTKPEFVAHITKRDVGQAIPMPGNQDWEAPDA